MARSSHGRAAAGLRPSGPRLNQSASSSTAGPSSKRRTLPAASRPRIALRSSGRMSELMTSSSPASMASRSASCDGMIAQRQALDLGLDVGPTRSVARVAGQLDALARRVGAEHVRAEAGDLGRRRRRRPRLGELAPGQGVAQLVRGQDGQAAQEAQARPIRGRQRQHHRVGVDLPDGEGLSVHPQAAGERALRLRIVEGLEGEDDVVGRERRAVREHHALAEAEGVGAAVRVERPLGGQRRLDVLGQLIELHQAGVQEHGQEPGRAIAGREPVERPRLGADGGDDRTRRHRRGRRARAAIAEEHRSGDEQRARRETADSRRRDAGIRGIPYRSGPVSRTSACQRAWGRRVVIKRFRAAVTAVRVSGRSRRAGVAVSATSANLRPLKRTLRICHRTIKVETRGPLELARSVRFNRH